MIMMTGEVTEGDAQRFDETVATLGGAHATLNVSGPGGLVNEALDIGAQVQEHRFATMVSPQTECLLGLCFDLARRTAPLSLPQLRHRRARRVSDAR